MKSNKTLIIVPAYNESDNIENVINNIVLNYPQYDYIIINDGSLDNTKEICRKTNFSILNLPINLGIGGAVQTGYKYAYENGYDYAVQIDGDGQHDVAFVKQMIQMLEQSEADIVIGSRFIDKKGFQSSGTRRFGIKVLSAWIKMCTGVMVKDVTSGFRAVNRKFIEVYSKDYPSDYPEPEAIVTGIMYGGKLKEVPVIMKERAGGESSIKFWNSIYYMIKVTLAIGVRRVSYGIRRSK
ncbi:MAG: glycosyltransferase family 2 protein [Lachnospiraceae bacterium]|nr:glycosyltransferase family 2 protein [Lachnospiraceae bacterium]